MSSDGFDYRLEVVGMEGTMDVGIVGICSSKKCHWKGVNGCSAKSIRIDQAGNTSSDALTADGSDGVQEPPSEELG